MRGDETGANGGRRECGGMKDERERLRPRAVAGRLLQCHASGNAGKLLGARGVGAWIDEKMRVSACDGPRAVFLPRFDADVDDATAVLGDDAPRERVDGSARAEKIDGDRHDFRQARGVDLPDRLHDGGRFEKSSDGPPVERRQVRIADEMLRILHLAHELAAHQIDPDAEKLEIRDGLDEGSELPGGLRARYGVGKGAHGGPPFASALCARKSMNVPFATATRSAESRG